MKVIFENQDIKVWLNDSEEVFISNKGSNVELRVAKYGDYLKVSSYGGIYVPAVFGGFPGFKIMPNPLNIIN